MRFYSIIDGRASDAYDRQGLEREYSLSHPLWVLGSLLRVKAERDNPFNLRPKDIRDQWVSYVRVPVHCTVMTIAQIWSNIPNCSILVVRNDYVVRQPRYPRLARSRNYVITEVSED